MKVPVGPHASHGWYLVPIAMDMSNLVLVPDHEPVQTMSETGLA